MKAHGTILRCVAIALVVLTAASACSRRPANLRDQAENHYEKGEFAEAAELFQQLAEQNPKDAELLRRLGQSRYAQGQYAEAVEALTAALKLLPEDPDLYLLRSRAYRELGNDEAADADGLAGRSLHPLYKAAFPTERSDTFLAAPSSPSPNRARSAASSPERSSPRIPLDGDSSVAGRWLGATSPTPLERSGTPRDSDSGAPAFAVPWDGDVVDYVIERLAPTPGGMTPWPIRRPADENEAAGRTAGATQRSPAFGVAPRHEAQRPPFGLITRAGSDAEGNKDPRVPEAAEEDLAIPRLPRQPGTADPLEADADSDAVAADAPDDADPDAPGPRRWPEWQRWQTWPGPAGDLGLNFGSPVAGQTGSLMPFSPGTTLPLSPGPLRDSTYGLSASPRATPFASAAPETAGQDEAPAPPWASSRTATWQTPWQGTPAATGTPWTYGSPWATATPGIGAQPFGAASPAATGAWSDPASPSWRPPSGLPTYDYNPSSTWESAFRP